MANEPVKKAPNKQQAPEKEAATPAPTERWEALASLRDEVDRMFEDFSWGWPMGPSALSGRGLLGSLGGFPAGWPTKAPAIDIVDLEKEIQIRAELPGIDEKDVDIEISGEMLTIKGEKKEEIEKGKKGNHYYMSERRYGSFERRLRIPEGADRDKPEAHFAKGVLTVTFPKTTQALKKAKKVKIKAE